MQPPPLNLPGTVEAFLSPAALAVSLGALGKAYLIDRRLKRDEFRHQRQLQDTSIFAGKRDEVYRTTFAVLNERFGVAEGLSRAWLAWRAGYYLGNDGGTQVLQRVGATEAVIAETIPDELIADAEAEPAHAQLIAITANRVATDTLHALAERWRVHTGTYALYLSPQVEDAAQQALLAIERMTIEPANAHTQLAREAVARVKAVMRHELSGGLVSSPATERGRSTWLPALASMLPRRRVAQD